MIHVLVPVCVACTLLETIVQGCLPCSDVMIRKVKCTLLVISFLHVCRRFRVPICYIRHDICVVCHSTFIGNIYCFCGIYIMIIVTTKWTKMTQVLVPVCVTCTLLTTIVQGTAKLVTYLFSQL